MTVGIVGAGITGLALGHHLRRHGVDYVILEARAEPGGAIRTRHVDGRVLELGPQRTRLTPGVDALVDALGLRDDVLTAPRGLPLYVYHDGRLRRAPFSLGSLLRTDLFSLRGKLRILLEPLIRPVRANGSRGPDHDDDESVARFLTRTFGREAYERLLAPLYGGLYASDPADMRMGLSLSRTLQTLGISGSVLASLLRRSRRRADAPPPCSFRDGLQTLPRALYRSQRENVRLETPVRHVRADGSGYAIETDDGAVTVERVVLTPPADVTARILEPVAADAAERLARLTYNPLAIVHLHADRRLEGLGYQVSFAERLATRGVTWNASLFDRDGVYTAFLGGARRPDMLERTREEIGEIARREFEEVTGCDARVLHVERVRMPAWDASWAALESLELPAGIELCANYESRAGIPGRLRRAEGLAGAIAAEATTTTTARR